MFTVILPIDFSKTSNNAVTYALKMAEQVSNIRYIFYHSAMYQDFSRNIDWNDEARLQVEELMNAAQGFSSYNYKIIVNNDFLIDSVKSLIDEYQASMVIMGISGKGKVAQTIIGSNTLAIAKQIDTPVLIIPEKAKNKGIQHLGLAIPFDKDTIKLVPYIKIRHLVEQLQLKLHVIAVDSTVTETGHIVLAGENAVHKMFDDLAPQYHLYQSNAVVEMIHRSIEEHHLDIVSTIAEQHSFWQSILKKSVTDTLAFNDKTPLLVLSLNH